MQSESKIESEDNVEHGGIMRWITGRFHWRNVFGFFATVTGLKYFPFLRFFGINQVQDMNVPDNQIPSGGQQGSWIRNFDWRTSLRNVAEFTGAVKPHPKVYMAGMGTAHTGDHSAGPLEIKTDFPPNYVPPAPEAVPTEVLQTHDTIMNNTGTKTNMKTTGSLKISTTFT